MPNRTKQENIDNTSSYYIRKFLHNYAAPATFKSLIEDIESGMDNSPTPQQIRILRDVKNASKGVLVPFDSKG